MLALSIRQPWAWFILHGGKDIENRTWPTNVRGRVLIHASSKAPTMSECEAIASWIRTHDDLAGMVRLFRERRIVSRAECPYEDITADEIVVMSSARGGIVGSVEIVGCVTASGSPWFAGPYGFMLRDPQPLPFRALHGRLGFFDVSEGGA